MPLSHRRLSTTTRRSVSNVIYGRNRASRPVAKIIAMTHACPKRASPADLSGKPMTETDHASNRAEFVLVEKTSGLIELRNKHSFSM